MAFYPGLGEYSEAMRWRLRLIPGGYSTPSLFIEPEEPLEVHYRSYEMPTTFTPTIARSVAQQPSLDGETEIAVSATSSASLTLSTAPLSPPTLKPRQIKRRLQQQDTPSLSISEVASLQCSICGCRFVRGYDLRRHHRGHNPTSGAQKKYVCNGVRIDRAEEYEVTNTTDAEAFEGELRVGRYCSREFTRKDSLLRHLKKHKCPCVCDVLPAAYYRNILGKVL